MKKFLEPSTGYLFLSGGIVFANSVFWLQPENFLSGDAKAAAAVLSFQNQISFLIFIGSEVIALLFYQRLAGKRLKYYSEHLLEGITFLLGLSAIFLTTLYFVAHPNVIPLLGEAGLLSACLSHLTQWVFVTALILFLSSIREMLANNFNSPFTLE